MGVLEVLGEVIYAFHGDEPGPPEEIVQMFIGEEGKDWHNPESSAFDAYMSNQARNTWSPIGSNSSCNLFRRLVGHIDAYLSEYWQRPIPTAHLRVQPPRGDIDAWTQTLARAARSLHLSGEDGCSEGAPNSRGEHRRGCANSRARARQAGPRARWWDFARSRDAVVRRKAVESLELFLQGGLVCRSEYLLRRR